MIIKYWVPLTWSLCAALITKLSVRLWGMDDYVWSLGLVIPLIICIYMIRSTFKRVKVDR